VSPQPIRPDHVEYIRATLAADGRLTAEALVADARRKDSPMHELFDWDVKRAAQAHWLERAREIIRTVKVVITTSHVSVRVPAYVRDPQMASHLQGYVSTHSLMADPAEARRALIIECERAATTLKRARTIALALDLSNEVDAMLEQLTGFRFNVEHSEAA
jgi:hypothetical protein